MTKVTSKISTSESNIKQFVKDGYAEIGIVSTVNGLSTDVSNVSSSVSSISERVGKLEGETGWFYVTNEQIYMGVSSPSNDRNRIGISKTSVSLYGNVYLSSNLSIGIYDVKRRKISLLSDDDYVWVAE